MKYSDIHNFNNSREVAIQLKLHRVYYPLTVNSIKRKIDSIHQEYQYLHKFSIYKKKTYWNHYTNTCEWTFIVIISQVCKVRLFLCFGIHYIRKYHLPAVFWFSKENQTFLLIFINCIQLQSFTWILPPGHHGVKTW